MFIKASPVDEGVTGVEFWYNGTDTTKPQYVETDIFRRHFIRHKSDMDWPRIEPESSWWKAGD